MDRVFAPLRDDSGGEAELVQTRLERALHNRNNEDWIFDLTVMVKETPMEP